jgi:hypothetical protein
MQMKIEFQLRCKSKIFSGKKVILSKEIPKLTILFFRIFSGKNLLKTCSIYFVDSFDCCLMRAYGFLINIETVPNCV